MTKIDFSRLEQETTKYFYSGYNLSFMHGWFCSYLSASVDSEDDLVIPSYLILNEDRLINEQEFSKFIDRLMLVYVDIADSIYEKNKQIKPLINFINPRDANLQLSTEDKTNLLIWLYGYLCGYLVIGTDVTEYCYNEQLLNDKFYPELLVVCQAFLLLDQELDVSFTSPMLDDYLDVKADIINMWEFDDGSNILTQITNIKLGDILGKLINALNNIFYTVRTLDEARLVVH